MSQKRQQFIRYIYAIWEEYWIHTMMYPVASSFPCGRMAAFDWSHSRFLAVE